MRIAKKIMTVLCTLAIVFAIGNVVAMDAEAATKSHTYVINKEKGVAYPTAVRTSPSFLNDSFRVYLQNPGDYVASVKSSSSNLLTKVIMTDTITGENSWYYSSYLSEDFKYKKSEDIGIYAKKPGTYRLTFTIKNAAKKKVLTKTVRIVVSECQLITKLKYAGKDIRFGTDNVTSKAQGKLSVAVGKEYKLKKIEVGSHNPDGTITYKTTKNNKKIKLSTVKQYTEVNSSGEYYENGTNYDYIYPETIIRLTIYDKKLKTTSVSEYSIFKK